MEKDLSKYLTDEHEALWKNYVELEMKAESDMPGFAATGLFYAAARIQQLLTQIEAIKILGAAQDTEWPEIAGGIVKLKKSEKQLEARNAELYRIAKQVGIKRDYHKEVCNLSLYTGLDEDIDTLLALTAGEVD